MSQLKDRMPSQAELEALPIVGPQPRSEKEEEHLKQMATFEFHNLEEPGMKITFPYGDTRYQKTFTFEHGGKYTLPRHVARHVETRGRPIWDYRPDGYGRMAKQKTGYNSRFQMRETFGE